jgi:hypothetical protein
VARSTSKIAWKAFGFGASIAATVLTRTLLGSAWKFVTGNAPPDSPEHPDTGTFEAVTWVLASGIGAAVARLLATRQAARTWLKLTGKLPPGMEHVDV